LEPSGSNFQVTSVLEKRLLRDGGNYVAQNVGRRALTDAEARAIDADQNGAAMTQNRDIGTFAHTQFAQFGALGVATAQAGHAQLLAAFSAAQRGAAEFVFVVRVVAGAARAKKHRFLWIDSK
jgi:hypothetical protein